MKANIKPISLLLVLLLGLTPTLYAAEIDLYDAPKADAKAVGKIDPSLGLIPIFTPKDGTWVKVADPRNGNVGWVNADKLSRGNTSFSFTQKIVNDGKGEPHTFQFIQYGTPANHQVNNADVKAMVHKMQLRHQEMQKSMHQLFRDMDQLYQQSFMDFSGHFPMLVPVVVMQEGGKQKPVVPKTSMGEVPKPEAITASAKK